MVVFENITTDPHELPNDGQLGTRLPFRDVPDTGIRYPVKFRHPALSGIRYKFAGYLPDSTVRYFVTTMKRKSLLGVYKL
jgi:hypothetical protein